jgi:hypothetical protein
MNNQVVLPRFVKWAFFVGLLFFVNGMLNLGHVLSFVGLENNFLASNGRTIPIVFIALIFGLGWWFENFTENLAISKGWNINTIIFPTNLLVIILVVSELVFTADSFLHSITLTSGFMFICGYFFRFSALRSETIARLQVRN